MKKVVVLNASPRKNWNTAKMLKEAQKGAEQAGAEVEYIDLVNLNYKGCMSCFACKRKGAITNGLCAYKDELRPILEKILNANAIIIGSPIYYSFPTGMFRNLLERMLFAAGTYLKDEETGWSKRVLKRNIPTGLIYTMNVPENMMAHYNYDTILNTTEWTVKTIFGYAETLNSYDTYQFNDYSKYDCDVFDEKEKAKHRDKQFPKDLEKAFDLGKRLVEIE
ncbi:flavodoxin family protein [bacterium]|nr:flavodoxin family protein [bacterium]